MRAVAKTWNLGDGGEEDEGEGEEWYSAKARAREEPIEEAEQPVMRTVRGSGGE